MAEYQNHILLISKPFGITSFKFTNLVREILKAKKAGHTGTLDPIATGLMVIALNGATKFMRFINTDRKEYVIRVRFGLETDTDDITGRIIRTSDKIPSFDEVESVIEKFSGEIVQEAPTFSAKKVNGTPFYELARNGKKTPHRKAKVTIFKMEIINYSAGNLVVRVDCSKGTYMRSLARDIGRACGSAATLSAIARTRAGKFSIKDATTLTRIRRGEKKGFVSVEDAITLPCLIVEDTHSFLNGVDIKTNFVKVKDKNGKFLGIGRIETGKIHPERVANEDI